MKANNSKSLISQLLMALLITSSTTLLAIYWLDKPIAIYFFVHTSSYEWLLRTIARIPEGILILCGLGYLTYFFAWRLNRMSYTIHSLLTACHSIVITFILKSQLKWLFGRHWPKTWIKNNPALIPDNLYGFDFMHGNQLHASMPSGHTAITVAAMTVLAVRFPKMRWLAIVCCLLVPACLMMLTFHFLADTIVGAGLGWAVAKICLATHSSPSQTIKTPY